jgi:hypothetical protein
LHRLFQALLIGTLSITSAQAAPALHPASQGVVLKTFEPTQQGSD